MNGNRIPSTSANDFARSFLKKSFSISYISKFFLPFFKLNKEIPLYKEKGNLIHIYAMAIFNLSKISF